MSDYVYASLLWNVSVYECAYLLYILFEKYTCCYVSWNVCSYWHNWP